MSEADISSYINSIRWGWYYDNFSAIATKLKKFYSKNQDLKLSDSICSTIFKKYSENRSYDTSYYFRYYKEFIKQLEKISEHYTPNNKDLTEIIKKECMKDNQHIGMIVKNLADRDVEYVKTETFFKLCIAHNKYATDCLIQYQTNLSPNILDQALSKGCTGLVAHYLYQKYQVSDDDLIIAVKSDTGSLIRLLKEHGKVFTEDMYKEAINTCTDPEVFEELLKGSKIIPTDNDILKLATRVKTAERTRYYYYNKNKDNEVKKMTDSELAKVFDILIEAGYKPTLNIIKECIKKKCYFNNISKYVEVDESVWEECTKNKYHPYNLSSVKPSISILREECKIQSNIKAIQKIIKAGTKPDIKCLENACMYKTNTPVVRLLADTHNIVPNKKCLENIANQIGNATLKTLISKLPDNLGAVEKKDMKNPVASRANSFAELQDDDIDIDEYSVYNSDSEPNDSDIESDDTAYYFVNSDDEMSDVEQQSIQPNTEDELLNKAIEESLKQYKQEQEINKALEEPEVEQKKVANKKKSLKKKQPTKSSKSKKEKTIIKKGKKNIILESDSESDADENESLISVSNSEEQYIPVEPKVNISKRKKYAPTAKMVKFWGLDKKTKLSFIDIRKKFVNYIKTNKLNTSKIIKIDKKINSVLGISENTTVDISDLDNVVMQFYK